MSLKTEAKIFDKHGQYVRTYREDLHGEDFMELAKGFAKKIGGSIGQPMDADSIIQRELTQEEKEKVKKIERVESVNTPKQFKCDECEFVAKAQIGLVSHKRRHN